LYNFRPQSYKVVVGAGFYYNNTKIKSDGKLVKTNSSTFFKNFHHTIDLLKEDPACENALFVLIDDCSPTKLDRMVSWTDRPFIYIELEKNVGVGGKENILQYFAVNFAEYLFRIDNDVKLLDSVQPCFDIFEKESSAGIVTINAGFCAYHLMKKCKKDYVQSGSAIGNATLIPSRLFEKISYSMPQLRFFEDIDLYSKFKYQGYHSYMSKLTKGNTNSSGAGINFERRQEMADILTASNPLLQYHLNKKGMPIFSMSKSYRGIFRISEIPKTSPSFLSLQILNEVLS
jgi:hypothetical protein